MGASPGSDVPAELPGLDLGRLAPYLVRNGLLPATGELHARRLPGGRSNLTYEVERDGVGVVVRRQPLSHVLATAHDMRREYRVIAALRDTVVPVPQALLLCESEEVLGVPFYVMERVQGRVLRSAADFETLDPVARRDLAYELIDVLAALHRIDPAEVGLADFGRPAGFVHRQVSRWSTQLGASQSRELAGAAELAAALAGSVPESPVAGIVHGDYRIDNAIVDSSGRIAAVLDWEMSTLGDPLTDVGLFRLYWDGLPPGPSSAAEMLGRLPGVPGREEILERYRAATGTNLGNLGWYTAFAAFKLAVILEGIYYRSLSVEDPGSDARAMGEPVEALLAIGLAELRGTAVS